jgi:hypothetical protein
MRMANNLYKSSPQMLISADGKTLGFESRDSQIACATESNLSDLGVPRVIASIGTPFMIPPGDGAANGLQFTGSAGAFTLSAAIITSGFNYLKGGFWLYLTTNFGGTSYPAGWYWAVMTTDTAGVVYADTYLSGSTIGPAIPAAFPVNLTGWLTSTTSEIVGPTGFILPGNYLGNSGLLQSLWSFFGNTTGTKYFFEMLGDVKIAQANVTTSPICEVMSTLRNAGRPSAQINSRSASVPPFGVGAPASSSLSGPSIGFTAIDTTKDQAVSVSLSVSTNTACAILVGLAAVANPGA